MDIHFNGVIKLLAFSKTNFTGVLIDSKNI